MAVLLSPVGGVAAQFFTNAGVPLSGGKIYTYAAGTSTPQATYTTGAGNIQHSNPIVLDAAGRVPTGEIWLTDGLSYKFVLKDANDVLIATYDNIVGINSNFVNFVNQQEIQTATAGQTVFTLTTMEYQPGTGNLSVFVDGVNQYGPGAQYAYTETSSTVVTFVSGLHVGASVKFTTTEIQNSGVADASQITYTYPDANAVEESVEERLAQYVSVKDFGAVGDGVTNDAPAFQAAIDSGAKYIVIPQPETRYLLEDSLNMTNLRGVTFDFQASTDINLPPILAKHTSAVFDLTGAFDCVFYSPNVEGDITTTPTCMFLLARNSTGASAGRHRFFNPRSNGYFSTAVFYNYGSEENDCYSPDFMQNKSGKSCVYLTSYNSANLTSEYVTIATGGQSTVCHRFYGGSFYSQGNSGLTNEAVFVLDSASDLSIDGAFMYCPNGIALIDSYSTNATSDVVSITNCRGEVSGSLPTYGIYFRGGATRTTTSWRILGNRLPADSYAVYGDDNITFDNFTYEGNVEPTGYSIDGYAIQYSYINHSGSYAVCRSSGNNNVWIGVAANRTATGQNGFFINTADSSASMGALRTTIVNPGATPYFIPSADNTYSLGGSGARWSVIWAATGTINTSDGNEKTEVSDLLDAEKRVAIRLKSEMKRFKFKDAVEKKGENARIHFGVIAQQVKAAFHVEGLNAEDYGVFCSDVLEDGSTRMGVRYEELFAFIIGSL